MVANNITNDYIQFSKKVTKWGIILVTTMLILCVILITFKDLPQYIISAVTSLYTSYITIMGITIGTYQGNSSLEKWTKAKYQFDVAFNNNSYLDEDENVIIDDIENTYG